MNMDLTTSNDESRNPASDRKKLIRMILFPVLAVLVIIFLTGMFCMFRNGLGGMNREFLFAAVLSIAATLAGSLALSLTWHYHPDYLPQAVMGAMGIKLFITLAGFVIFALIFKPIRLEFAIYMALFYLTGLVGETVVAIKMTRRMNDSSGPADTLQR